MAERGRKIGIHLQSIHDGVPSEESDSDDRQEQYLPEDLADELRKRTTSVDSEIKQLENQMGQLQRTLVKGKARRESMKHRISVSNSPGGTRKASAITPYLPTPEHQSETASKEDLKARLEALENEKQELQEDKKDLNDEIKFLKYQLQYRLEVQTLQNERESSSKTESHVKLENENKALREENKDLRERLSVIRTKLKESGNEEETLLSATEVSDSEDGGDESSLESELDRLYTERKILLSTIMRIQNLDREDYRRDSVSFTDYGVQCDLIQSGKDQTDRSVSPLLAKLTEENEAIRKRLQEVENENEEMTEENRALDEENTKLTEEKRTLEDTINKLRAQINDTLDTTLDEIEHLHSFNEELEGKLQRTDAHGKELSQTLDDFKEKISKALANVLNVVENKTSDKDITDYLRTEIERINEENNEFVKTGLEHEIKVESSEEKTFPSNLLNEVKTCKDLLESQRSHIRELQMDKRDIEEGYTKMKRELLILRSNRQKERKKEWLSKRRAKSMNDGLLSDQDMDRSMAEEHESLKREIKRLHSTKTRLDEVIRGIKKEKLTLEEEKVCLLGSLYHQLERNESLEVQIEELTAVLEQWEEKSDLGGSVSDVVSPTGRQAVPPTKSEAADEAKETEPSATTTETSPTSEDASDSAKSPADELYSQVPEASSVDLPTVVQNEPITVQDEAGSDSNEASRVKSTLVNVVDSATGESLHEMQQKIHALVENLRSVQESVSELEIERDKLQNDLEECKRNEKELGSVVIQLKRESSMSKDKLQKASDLAETLQECLKEAHDEKADLVESLEEANEEKIVAKRHSDLLDNRLKEVTQQRDVLKKEIEPLKVDNVELKVKCEKAEEKLKEIHKMLDDIGKLAPISQESTDKESDNAAIKEDSEKCIDDLGKEIISWLGTVFVDVDRTKKELKRTNSEQNRLKSRLDTVLTERQALQKYVREIDDKKRQMKMFITKLTEEKEKLTDQIDETRQQKANLADALENVYQSKEKLQHRLDESLCKQDQYRNSLLEAVDEARALKESLYRMVNEHETMKESLLNANREIGRLKSKEGTRPNLSPEADQVDLEDEESQQEMEKGQRESKEGKEYLASLEAERNGLQEQVNSLLQVLETLRNDTERLEQDNKELLTSENNLKASVTALTRENKILKSHFEKTEHGANEEEVLVTSAFAMETENSPEDTTDGTRESDSQQETETKGPVQSFGLSGLWENLSQLGTENSQLQNQLRELEEERDTLQCNLKEVFEEKEDKEKVLEETSSDNATLKDNLSQRTPSKEHEDRSSEVEQLKEWYEVICKEKEQLEKELESTTKDNEELMQDFKRVIEEKEEFKQQLKKTEEKEIRQEFEPEQRDEVNKIQVELKKAVEENEKLQDLLEAEQKQTEALKEREQELKDLQADTEKNIVELVGEGEKLAKEKTDLINSLYTEIDVLKQKQDRLASEAEKSSSENHEEREKILGELHKALDEIPQLKAALDTVMEENDVLKQRENDSNELQADFENRLEELVANTDKLVEEKVDIINSLQSDIAALNDENEKQVADAETLAYQLQTKKDELQHALDEVDEVKALLENVKEENDKLRKCQADLEEKVKDLTDEKQLLAQEKTDLLASLQKQMESLGQEVQEVQVQAEVADAAESEIVEEPPEETLDRVDIENELTNALEVYQRLQSALDATKEENEVLKEKEQELKVLHAESENKIDELTLHKEKLINEKIDLVNSLHERMAEMNQEKDKLAEETVRLMNENTEEKERLQNDLKKALDEVEQIKALMDATVEESETLKQNDRDLAVLQADLEKRIDEMVADKETLVQEKVALVNSLHAEKADLTRSMGKLREERNTLYEYFTATENDLKVSINETVNLEKQVELLSRESASMKEESEERIQKLIELEEKVIVTMEKKLELAEYAATLKSKKQSLEKKCAELSTEIESLQRSRDEILAGKSESEKSLNEKVNQLIADNEKSEADIVQVRNALRIGKQDIEVLKIKLDSMDRKNKELNEELNRAKNREELKATELNETSGSLEQALGDHEKMQKESNERKAKIEEMKDEMRKANEELEKILAKNDQLSKILSDLNVGMDSILKEEITESTSPDAKLEKLKDKFTKLEERVNKVTEAAERNSKENNQLCGFLDTVSKEMGVILKDDVTEEKQSKQKDKKIEECVEGVNGVHNPVTEKGKPGQSLDKLMSTIETLKKQLDDSYEREKNAREQLRKVRDDNKRILREIKVKSNFLKTMKNSFEKLEQGNKQFAKKAAEKAMRLDDSRRVCSELKQEVSSLKNELQESQKSKKEMDSWFATLKKEHGALASRLRSMTQERVELTGTAAVSMEQPDGGLYSPDKPTTSIEEVVAGFMLEPSEDTTEEVPIQDEIVVQLESQGLEACPTDVEVQKSQGVKACPADVEVRTIGPCLDEEVTELNPQVQPGENAQLQDRVAQLEVERNTLKELLRQMEDKYHVAEHRVEDLEVALSEVKHLETPLEVFHSEIEEVETLRHEIREREKSIGDLHEKIETLEKDNTSAQSQCQETRQILQKRSSSLQDLQEKLGVSKHFMQKILKENTDLKESITQMEQENNELREKLEDLQKRNEAIGLKLEQVTTEKNTLQLKHSKIEEEVAGLKERLTSRKDLLHSLEKDRETFKTSLRESKKEIESLEDRIEYMNECSTNEAKRRDEAEKLVEKLKATRNQIAKDLEDVKLDKKHLDDELNWAKNEVLSLTKETEELKSSHSATCTQLEEANTKVESLTREMRREKIRKDRQIGNIKKESAKLQNDGERSENEAANLRKQLQEEKNRNDTLEELVGTIKKESDKLRKSLESETQEKEKTTKVLEGNKKEGKRLLTMTEDLKSKMTTLEALIRVVKNEKKVLEEELKGAKAVNADLRMRVNEAVEDKEELEEILEEMREKRKKLHDEIEKALNERDAFEDELLTLKQSTRLDKEAAEKEKRLLEEKLDETVKEKATLQTKLKDLERKNIHLLREKRDTKRELDGQLQASEKETSPLLLKIDKLEKMNRELVQESKVLKKDLKERKKETDGIRKEMDTTEVKVKAFVEKQKMLENKVVLLQKSHETVKSKDVELQKARTEISLLMNKIESLNDRKITEVRQIVCEDIEAVEVKELHAAVADQMDSAPAHQPNVQHFEEQITNHQIENTRMQARLEAADNKLMTLQEELYRISKEQVIEEKKLKDSERESTTLRENLHTSKQEQVKLKKRLENSDEIQIELRRYLQNVTKEKETLQNQNEMLKRRRPSIIEKVMVTSSEVPVASELPDLDVEPLAKATSMGSARKEIIMLETHVKDLRGQIRKAREEHFDLTHELSDKGRELKQQNRLHLEEKKRLKAEVTELETDNAKLRSELQNAVEFERSRSTFSTVQDLKGSHRKAESEMKEVIAQTADLLKRAKEGSNADMEDSRVEREDSRQSRVIPGEKERIMKELEESERANDRLSRRLKRTEGNNQFLKKIVADMVLELDKVRRLVGFYTGVGERTEEKTTAKRSDKQELVETLDNLSSGDNEELQVSLNELRAKIRNLEKGLQDQKDKGDDNLQDLLKSRNSKLQAELSNATKEKVRACEKLRYLQDQLSKILAERRVIQDIGVDTRRELQKLIDCLTTEREEKEAIISEYSGVQKLLRESKRSEEVLGSKLEYLKEEVNEMHRRKQRLEQELSDVRVHLEVEKKQGDHNVKATTAIEADYEQCKHENYALDTRNKQLEVQCLESEKALERLARDYEDLKQMNEALGNKMKEIEDDKRTLVQETHAFKLKMEKKHKELTECIEGKELDAITLRATNEGLSAKSKKLEGQIRSLERDKEILNASALSVQAKNSQLELVNREQQDEIQELILQKSRENFVGEQLEKLFYENTRLKEQKKVLVSRIEGFEKDLQLHISKRKVLESEREDLLVQLDKQHEANKNVAAEAEHWRRLLEKQEEESGLQVDALSLLAEKLRREKEDIEKKGTNADQITEEYNRLDEENTYLSDLLNKTKDEVLELKKENILLRRACQQLLDKKGSGGSAGTRSRGSSSSSLAVPSMPGAPSTGGLRETSASSLTVPASFPSSDAPREISISSQIVPHPGFSHGAAELRSSSFNRASPDGSDFADTSTDRMETSYRHSTPVEQTRKPHSSQRSPRSLRRSGDITPAEAVSLQSSEADSTSICSREYYCSPILSVVDKCPVHRHPSSERSPTHCPICKKDKSRAMPKEFVTLEKYV